ncbi:MAG TPA: carboxypeptidase regulatory-like domain-containing protein [Candidatus Acidoferrales bacterium]|nr:carboxypeptidase regulatory-like domain-containing protein [Candidatus Acidoferrales bacterium]
MKIEHFRFFKAVGRVALGLALACLTLLCVTPLWAQETGEILGTVTDSTGAVVPGATVTLTNIGTGVVQAKTTNGTGDYLFPLLQVGNYSVKVAATGFKSFTVPQVALSSGDRFRADAKLQVGEAAQTVEVSGAVAPALQTDSSQVGSLVPSQSVEDLPLDGRNLIKLVQLTPGVTEGSPGSIIQGNRPDDRRQTSSFSANGQTDTMNQNLVDGMDNNERIIGTVGVRPSIDAVQEVNIQTNKYDASVGRTGGAVVDVITKSGTNAFHGSAYEFFRNKVLNTNPNWNFKLADNPVADGPSGANIKGYNNCNTAADCKAAPNPVFRQNQFGGSLGGPIKKNKTFFFADWEHLGYAYAPFGAQTFSVPTVCERGSKMAAAQGYTGTVSCPDGTSPTTPGDFSDINPVSPFGGGNKQDTATPGANLSDTGMNLPTCTSGSTPGSCISTLGLAYMSMYPLPNQPGTQRNYVSTPVKTFTSDTWDARIDQHFSDRDTLYGRFTHNGETTINPNGFPNAHIDPATGYPEQSGGLLITPVVTSYAGPNYETQDQTTISYLHVFNPNVVLNLKLGVFRSNIASWPANNGTDISNKLGFPCDATACINAEHITPGVVGTGLTTVNPTSINGAPSYNAIGDTNWIPLLEYDTSFQYMGIVTWTHGAHNVRFGATLIRRRATIGQSPNPQGTFTFNGSFTGVTMGDVLEGLNEAMSRKNTLRQPGFRSWEPSVYVQDDWRARPWLTLNLGLRYDIFTPYTEVHGRISQFNPYTGLLMSPAIPGTDQSPTVGVPTPYKDIAPRFGFAATLPHSMVLRGGFGLTFFPVNYESPYYFNNPPFSFGASCNLQNEKGGNNSCGTAQFNGAPGEFSNGVVANYGTCPFSGSGCITGTSLTGSTVYCPQCAAYGGGNGGTGGGFLNFGLPTPVLNIANATDPANYAGQSFEGVPPFINRENYLEQFNLELQKQLGANVFTLGYVGQIGRHISPLNNGTNQNVAANPTQSAPGNATLPLVTGGQSAYGYGFVPGHPWAANSFGVTEEGALGTSVYNAMQATLVRRFHNGLTVNVGYTWTHMTDNVAGPRSCVVSMFGPYEPCFLDEAAGLGENLDYQSASFPLVTSCAAEANNACHNVFGWQHSDWGNSAQNVPNRITWQVNYQLPFGKSATGFENILLGGWSVNSQGSHQSGLPYSVGALSFDPICNANNVPGGKNLLMWFNPNCFVKATPGTLGNEHPNQFRGPGLDRFDFSIFKSFSLNERFKLQFRAEAFNLFNTPMFNTPNTSITFTQDTINAKNAAPPVQIDNSHLPGEIQSMNANWNQRELQLALKLIF